MSPAGFAVADRFELYIRAVVPYEMGLMRGSAATRENTIGYCGGLGNWQAWPDNYCLIIGLKHRVLCKQRDETGTRTLIACITELTHWISYGKL